MEGKTPKGVDAKVSDVDGMQYTTLLYGNGPGFGRENLTGVDTGAKNAVQQSGVPRQWATHGGEDVPVYARGPGSSLFRGSLDQTFLPHAIAYAACIGEHKDRCKKRPPTPSPQPSLLPLAAQHREGNFLRDPEDCAEPLAAAPAAPPSSRAADRSATGRWFPSPAILLLLHWIVLIC
ncbi:hypothetical protein J437_LFUL018478 [Ladona fulva]|uniref:alkaline phosphatase n=1 Tax=Ladona fulva TaxID=123851 RepID=A0A8K0KDN8_LADFU|nr:hypothetical protein J437_LFUL018478 [Ladona fulva]